jgi:hypothetical protein
MTDEELVIGAERIIAASLKAKELKDHAVTGHTQVSNAIEIAKTTDSLAVFRNWLRYQKHREPFWRVKAGETSDLAGAVEQMLEQIEKKNRQVGRETDTMNQAIRFLGFFKRALVAKDHFDQIPAATTR